MYGSGLSYSRLRSTYDDPTANTTTTTRDRYHLPNSAITNYGWQSSLWSERPSSSKSDARRNSSSTMASSSGQQRKPQRYARASTTSVTQLLSDSCSNLLQKLTTRVRGPSATVERNLAATSNNSVKGSIGSTNNSTKSMSGSTTSLLPTRNKLEDKYSYVLDRIYGRRRDHEKTLEPSVGRTLTKSATTSNVILSEKAYPYVSAVREKTPYKNENRHHHHYYHHYVPQYPEPPYSYLDRESAAYRVRHRSNHSELRPRRSSKPQQRTGKSEAPDRNTNLKLHAVEIPLQDDAAPKSPEDDEVTPTPSVPVAAAPDPLSEREAKRKEIQSLIMKYSALDEAYNRGVEGATTSTAATIAQKYYPRLGLSSAVSRKRTTAPPCVVGWSLGTSSSSTPSTVRPSLTKHHECAFRVPLTLCKSSSLYISVVSTHNDYTTFFCFYYYYFFFICACAVCSLLQWIFGLTPST